MKTGKFREDLYYRINILQVKLPPLRERKEDIPLLIEHFIERFNNTMNKSIADISPEVLSILMTYDYKGNVRELENIIEHAFVLCRNTIIDTECLPQHLLKEEIDASIPVYSVNDFEKQYIIATLKRNNWNRTKTAAELRINKSTLWRKIRKFGITTPDKE